MNRKHKVLITSIISGVVLLTVFMLIVIPRGGTANSQILTEAQKIKAFLDTSETKEVLADAEKTCKSKYISTTNKENIKKYLGKIGGEETTLAETKADFEKLKQSNKIAKVANSKAESLARKKKEGENMYAGIEGEHIFSNGSLTITYIDGSKYHYRCKPGEVYKFYVEKQFLNGVEQEPFSVSHSISLDPNYEMFHPDDNHSSAYTSVRSSIFGVDHFIPLIYTDARGNEHVAKDYGQVQGTNNYRVTGRITKSSDNLENPREIKEEPDGTFDITIPFYVPKSDFEYAAQIRAKEQNDETKGNKTPSRTPATNGDPTAGSTFRPNSEKTYQLGTVNADTVNFRFFNQMADKVLVKGDKLWISTQKTQQTVGDKQYTFRLVGYVKTAEWGWVAENYIDFIN